MTTQSKQVAVYLEGLGAHIRNVRPVIVAIKGVTYYGAQYDQIGHYESSMAAVQRGERKHGEEYTDSGRIFLVGSLPKCYQRKPNGTCFVFPRDMRDWCIGTYATAETVKDSRYAEYHPFGETFILMPWSAPVPGQGLSKEESSL